MLRAAGLRFVVPAPAFQFAGRVGAPTVRPVLGALADFFRLWWGLIYWNTRKSWFQVRRGRSPCPCQTPSDSGRAFETGCEACVTWHRPRRFRRVCPLLVDTPDGLRCSANTAEVRPFWLRALGFYGGGALSIYLIGAVAVFGFLRTVGYPVNIFHVVLPPMWHRVTEVRGWFFLHRSQQSFAAGRTAEGLLYLANAYQFDPNNYVAGMSLAKHLQVGQPARSDQVFEQLMREHSDKQAGTAQDWFRALLARGSFQRIAPLARDQILARPEHGGVWLRALFFASRRTGDDAPLRELLASQQATAVPWHRAIESELLLRAGRKNEARALLEADWPATAPAFTIYYRVNALLELGDPIAALDLAGRHRAQLDATALTTLRLHAFAIGGGTRALQQEVDAILGQRLSPSAIVLLSAHLIRHPNRPIFLQLWHKVLREPPPLTTDNAGAWFSLLCAAGAVGDHDRLRELTTQLRQASGTSFNTLAAVEAFFRGETAERRINVFLPLIPLPLDVTYALIERYSAAPAISPPPVSSKRA